MISNFDFGFNPFANGKNAFTKSYKTNPQQTIPLLLAAVAHAKHNVDTVVTKKIRKKKERVEK